MSATWNHPDFGEFTFDGHAWTTSVEMPAFRRFSYVSPYGEQGPPSGRCELNIGANDESDVPSAEMLTLVSKVLENQERLAPAIASALWADFNGRGPCSGMWWHGSLEQVTEDVDPDLPPLTGPDALFAWLRLSVVRVRKRGTGEKLMVELAFEAPFEEEHGVGVLTDGVAILGTGYSYDVTPF
jgi:hypothetical protein